MKILKSFNVKLTKLQIKEIRKHLNGISGNFAIIAQPRIKTYSFDISNPSMDVAIVDDDLFMGINSVLRKSKCEPPLKS